MAGVTETTAGMCRTTFVQAIKSLDSLNDQIVQYIFGPAAADPHGHSPSPPPLLLPPPTRNAQQPGEDGVVAAAPGGGATLTPKEQQSVQASMVLIRRLLHDAQGKFRSMVEENKQLAVRIDSSLQSANHEVHALRAELADTNKRLSEISNCQAATDDTLRITVPDRSLTPTDSTRTLNSSIHSNNSSSGSIAGGDSRSHGNNHNNNSVGTSNGSSQEHLIHKLREENACLEHQVRLLCQEVTSLRGGGGGGGGVDGGVAAGEGGAPFPSPSLSPSPSPSACPSYGELKLELIQSRQELNRAKEALQAMKGDRKRLKTEKVELLHQMKQLYVTLEDKESELRDFIRNYEQRVQESDESIKQLAVEKEECEREKWEIIKKARESAERTVVLRTQLDARDTTIKELQEEVAKLKEQLSERGYLDDSRESDNATPTPAAQDNGHVDPPSSSSTPSTTPSCLLTPNNTTTNTSTPSLNDHHHVAKTSTPLGSSGGGGGTSTTSVPESGGSETGSCHTPEGYLSKDDSCSGGTPMSTPSFSDRTHNESLSSLMKWMTLSMEQVEGGGEGAAKHAKKKKKSFGSLSRVFGRGRSRRSIALPHTESLFEEGGGCKLSPLTPDNYQEKLGVVEALAGVPMAQWRAGQVLAWLEISLGMPMYGRNCAHNIKSGKILLGLSDSELGTALGITNHIHKRKLRLAIEEHRDPTNIKFPQASRLDVTWVAHKLLPDLGLPQYSHVFEVNLVDGRLLHSLSRRDLEKHFDIHRKFHQASILHAVELLRRMEFDREKLAERRSQCEDSDSDLIVWTCGRLVAWVRSIDLGEFADHLQESGVHGAMMVLEPSFNADTLATALAIPPSKAYIRRHLATELDTLLRPARAALDTPNNNSKHLDPGGKGYTFTRSYRGHSGEDGTKGRLSFRGSLGRAFGKKIRDDLKLAFDSDSPKWKISAPIPINTTPSPLPPPHRPHPQHGSSDNVVEIPGESTAV
ncbi:kazrin-like isoform X2 [Babylonia areolata]|uniref:kazrin-like isoform X2 n=1 Tax=Babylonia areolata TaxID=304850 RepID=UPI003FD5D533